MNFFSKSLFLQITILLSAVLLLQSCGDDPTQPRETDFSTVPDPYDLSEADSSFTKEGGIEIYVIKEGGGPFEVVSRDVITLYYTGRTSEGEVFESTYANGNTQPVSIRNLTPNTKEQQPPQVEGFRRGLLGMKEGERRVIIVPSELGYDNSNPGTRSMDLRDKDLRYDVELESIQ